MQINKDNQTMMSKQGSLPKIGLILQEMNRPKKLILTILLLFHA